MPILTRICCSGELFLLDLLHEYLPCGLVDHHVESWWARLGFPEGVVLSERSERRASSLSQNVHPDLQDDQHLEVTGILGKPMSSLHLSYKMGDDKWG